MQRKLERSIILASSSPRRKQLLSGLGLAFEVYPSAIDESMPEVVDPDQLVERLAMAKAAAVAKDLGRGLVIGADTVVVLEGEVLGKPADEEEARIMLSKLQGRAHLVYSGLAILDVDQQRWKIGHQYTKVVMASLTAEEIKRYVASKEPLDKAGAYAIQGLGATFIEYLEGDYFTVVGLPLRLTAQFLKEFGVDILEPYNV